ncbi:hypothetical protein TrVE_jg11650 [Triparma verrucosa]|uniref:Uncharacterized protein n=2 Tax=Triparma TaxID=722752 RepID=A0A9W6Z9I0_9STRA|nr:hypothetical protein TrVE_jg11650 [Triparma verrucosa]
MTQADCKRLDEHLAKYKHHFASNDFYEPASVSVSEAYALYKSIKVDAPSADQDRLDAIRSVAGMALQNLFSYNVWRSGAVQSHEEGLTIIDDDELVAEASDEYFRSNNAAGLNEGGMDEVFPELSLEATRKGEGYKADIEGVKGVVERAAEEKEREDERRREEERRRRVVEARLRVERAAERRRLKLMHEDRIKRESREEAEKRTMVEEARRDIEEWRKRMFDEAERTKEERDKIKKAAKKKRDKERQKEKKRVERERKEIEEKQKKIEEEKKMASLKCTKCGEGIPRPSDVFVRSELPFCSTKCSRSHFL